MKYKLLRFSLLAIFAMLCGTVFADQVTMKYSGTTTTNMTGGNDAELFGLDADEWSVVGAKGANSNFPGLNKAGDFRLYGSANGGNTITVTSLSGATINSISMTFTGESYSNVSVTVVDKAVEAVEGVYTINSTSFVLGNANTTNVQVRISELVIDYTSNGSVDNAVATKVTIDASGITNTNVFSGTAAGRFTAMVTAGDNVVSGAAVTWSSSDEGVATIASDGTVTLVAAGTTTITAAYAGVADQYKASKATYSLVVINSDPNASGSADNPYTVAQARAAIDAETGVTGVYAKGIVSAIVTPLNTQYGNITYNISEDGTTTADQLQSYRGKSYQGADFTSTDDIQVGDEVVIFGNLKKYNTTYEFDANNQLVSLNRKQDGRIATTLTIGEVAETGARGEVGGSMSLPQAVVTDAAGVTVCDAVVEWSSSKEDVATIADGVINFVGKGTTTITATFAGDDNYKNSEASFELTVTKPIIIEDGVFDFDMGVDYGSGVEKSNVKVQESTWTAGNVTMMLAGRNCWNDFKLSGVDFGQIRLYGANSDDPAGTLTLSVPEGKVITNIAFTGATLDKMGTETGEYAEGTWTGSANSVTFTATARTDIYTITVGYEDATVEPAVFQNFAVIVNNQEGTLLTTEEQVQGTAVTFGVAVDAEGNTVRVAADDAKAFATVSGNYHSDHGMTNLKVITAVPGAVKILVGQCTYSSKDIKVMDETGTVVASATPATACWKNDRSNVTEIIYDGEAATLTITGMDYCPFVAVKEYVAPAEFQDFAVQVNNQDGTLLTAEEMATQYTAVMFGVAVDAEGNTVRVAADDAKSIATVSGKYHSDHGMTGLKVVTAVPGAVKILVGQCTYSSKDIVVTNSEGAVVATATPATACWKNDHNNVTEIIYDGEATTLTITGMDYCPFVAVQKTEVAPVAQDITGTWTYCDAGVMEATMALSGSTEAGEVEAVEKNGLMMVVEANGVSFRNNGDNIQVRSGAVFKIPVRNAGDLITVKGYPGYSYYTIGNSTVELNNENTYTAKRSDAEAGYVAVTSTNDNNYYYSISVVQYAPKEKVTLDNEPATITFPFNEGTEGQTATFSNADYFLNSKVSHGTGVVLEGQDNKGMNQTWFNPVAKDSKVNEGNAIRFLFTPKPGLTFTPTKVSFKSTRFGTNGGKLDIAWQNPDGTAVNLASGEQPVRDNADPNVSEFAYDVAGAAGGEGACGLCINLYSLDNGKHVGFSDILIEGVLNGTEKDVPVLASFKINGNEYAVEDVFGEAYEATLELPKAEQMVGANNPLTDVTAASGEVGEITYEEKDDACTVTIPMTAGDTQMNYILNVVFKPDFTLTYLDVEGNVLTTQTVEKDAKIGQFAYNIENVSSTKNGFKARGWFKQDYLGAKFTIEDVIISDVNLYAIETEMEVPSASRKYVYDLTNQWFYDEDHEGFNSLGSGYWHDTQHGWAFNNGDQIELLVGPKATINFSLCQYSKAGATIVGSNGASTIGVVESDGGAGSMDYEGEPGTLTLTINSEGAVYIHSITVFNTSEANFAQQGEWIIVKQGDASSLLDAIEVAKGIENAKIFVPDGTYDLGETVKTVISGKNVSLIGQSAEKTVIVNRPPVAMEGLDKADLLKNTGEGLYMQDITLKNDLSYGGNDGRAAALHDQGTKTIGKNVFLLSHQDTYYSHRVGGLFYWEGGELHGTVDYLCGNGKVYYQDVKLVNEVRGSATVTANSEVYVFNNCTIENHAGTWNLGRAWSDNPVCVYLNTTMLDPDHLASTRWNLSGLNCDYSVAGEYGTKNANGSDITPESNWVTFTKQNTRMNTILDASALDTYSMENVLGEWAATAKAETMQVGAPLGTYENGTVSFTPANNGAIAYALFKNGEFVGITEGSTFDVEATKADKLTIRAANSRGGFGEQVEVTISTGVEEIANGEQTMPETIYNLNGVRVQKAQKGLYIINGRKVVMK